MKTAERLARVCVALALLVSTSSCRYVLGLDDPPGASACVRASDCNSGESCQQNKCVCTGPACGDAGKGPEISADSPELSSGLAIALSLAPIYCSGQSYPLQAEVPDGTSSYTWTISGDPEITLITNHDSRARLDFNPRLPGSYAFVLSVSDASGQSIAKDFSLTVAEPPQVVADPLPSTCIGQPYTTPLKARGGSGSSYVWSTEAPDTVNVADGVLSMLPAAEGAVTFTATVSDGTCTSARQMLTIAVAKAGTSSCPRILPETLPAPCLDNDYSFTEIKGEGGKKPYTWKVLEQSPGLAFDTDPNLLKLSGVPIANGTFTLELTDSDGTRTQRRYTIAPRLSCWLGYSTTAAGASTFNLYDHVLEATRTFSPSDPAASVSDFAFSPDGEFVVFASHTATGPTSLQLLSAPTWTAQPLDVGGSVLRYAWSKSSSVLAVTYQTSEGAKLGGFDFSNVGQAHLPGTSLDVRQLTPTAITVTPTSDLAWYGDGQASSVAFSAPTDLSGESVPAYSALGATGFDLPQLPDSAPYVEVGPTFHRAGTGFFVFAKKRLDYYDPANVRRTVFLNGFPDPAGAYVAKVVADQLTLFLTNPSGSAASPPKWTEASGCGLILAWAADKERVACVSPAQIGDAGANSDPHTIVAFDIVAGSKTIAQVGPVKGGYTYPIGDAKERRRVFSPSGDWLALTTDNTLLVATFAAGTPSISATMSTMDPTVTSELAFAPDESGLLWSHGGQIWYTNLRDGSRPRPVSYGTAAAARPCVETFVDSEAWCGATPTERRLAWSSDSRIAATLGADGSISTFEPADFNQPRVPNTACSANCSPHYEFQPARTAK